MLKRFGHIRIVGSTRVWLVVILLMAEVVFAFFLWQRSTPGAKLGYLLKVGHSYIIAWKGENSKDYDSAVYSNLEDAVGFAYETLGLTLNSVSHPSLEIEYLSLQDRSGAFILHWKLYNQSFLNQLSFYSQSDALFFARAFKEGAYTPSPFGHSILFLKVNQF